jgi:hypothetical protein
MPSCDDQDFCGFKGSTGGGIFWECRRLSHEVEDKANAANRNAKIEMPPFIMNGIEQSGEFVQEVLGVRTRQSASASLSFARTEALFR